MPKGAPPEGAHHAKRNDTYGGQAATRCPTLQLEPSGSVRHGGGSYWYNPMYHVVLL